MRLRVLVAAGAVLASLLSPVGANAAGATTDTSSAAGTVSRDKARKLAKAAILKKSDLSAFSAEHQTADPSDAEHDSALYACVGVPKPTYLVENPGFAFTKGRLEIDSEASVVDTGKHAKADFKALNTAKGASCYQQVLRAVFEEQTVTVDKVTVKVVRTTVEGVRTSFAFTYDLSGSVNGVSIRLQGFDLNVLVGQTEFALSSYRVDGRLPKLNQLVVLAGPLVERIRAA